MLEDVFDGGLEGAVGGREGQAGAVVVEFEEDGRAGDEVEEGVAGEGAGGLGLGSVVLGFWERRGGGERRTWLVSGEGSD